MWPASVVSVNGRGRGRGRGKASDKRQQAALKTRREKRKACGIFMLQVALICFTRRNNKEAANRDKGGEGILGTAQ